MGTGFGAGAAGVTGAAVRGGFVAWSVVMGGLVAWTVEVTGFAGWSIVLGGLAATVDVWALSSWGPVNVDT